METKRDRPKNIYLSGLSS